MSPRRSVARASVAIRIAAQLQHPHVLPLHDSGEVDGMLFYVMPYVEGETLRDRLRRERQLPVHQAVEIAREVADGLAHAHAMGVIHRDIKPENILLSGGHAEIADFGIARAVAEGDDHLTQTGLSPGTPVYMSPEQAGGDVVDGRSDVYSLGCVLYEMLAGEPPFVGATQQALLARKLFADPPPLTVLRPSVPAPIEREVVRSLQRVPADRHDGAEQFATALREAIRDPDAAHPPVRGRRMWPPRAAVFLASAVGVVAIAMVLLVTRPPPLLGFQERDWVLVTDVQSTDEHVELARTLGMALRIGLEQTSHANVFSPSRVAGMLDLMDRPRETPIDETVGREMSLRAGIKGLLIPALAAAGDEFLITLRLLDPASGDVVASYARRAGDRSTLLRELDVLLGRMRRDLGESLLAVRRTPPLPAITTSSFEALERFVAGRRAWSEGKYRDAIGLFEEAVQLDTNFAFAYAALGNAYSSWMTHEPERGRRNFEAALARLDRVGPRERYFIQAQYHAHFGREEDAIRFYRLHLEQYPDDLPARQNLANTHRRLNDCARAIPQYMEVVRLDSTEAGALVNIATCHAMMHQGDEAIAYYRRAFAIRPEWEVNGNLNHEYGITLAKAGRRDEARALFERRAALTSQSERGSGHRSLAQLALLEGRFRRAREHLQQAYALHAAGREMGSAARDLHWLGIAEIVAGDTARARQVLERAGRDTGWDAGWLWLQARIGRALLAAGDSAGARRVRDRLAASSDSAERSSDRMERDLLTASLLTSAGRGDSAVALLRSHERDVPSNSEILQVLIDALFAAGRREDALERLGTLIELQPITYEGLLPWIVAHHRYGGLAESLGRSAEAERAYVRLVELWGDADPELLPLVQQARERVRRDP